MQRGSRLDVAFDIQYELLHCWLVIAVADDLECLHHGDAGREHRGELTAEYRDIARVDFAAPAESLRLFADPRRRDSLPTQLGAQGRLIGSEALTFDARAALILAFPGEGYVAF